MRWNGVIFTEIKKSLVKKNENACKFSKLIGILNLQEKAVTENGGPSRQM